MAFLMDSGTGPNRPIARLLLVTFVALLLHATHAAGQSVSVPERQVKAAFVYNFVKFVTWPADAFRGAGEPATVCVVGRDLLKEELERLTASRNIRGHPFRVIRIDQPDDATACQVLFIGSEQGHLREFLAHVREHAVLTVGESDGFAAAGGMITFFLENEQVRFEVNLQAAEHANVKISSKLLTLARSVRVGGE